MAEYTPNFNLSMPEQTDTQESFIADYRANMGIIDDNLGGGGGNADVVHLTKAEYDALPDTKLSDDKIYMLIDVPTDEETLVYPICYSTLEREVGCWIDGKPLYQRTFDIGSTTISYNSWTVSSIPKGDMETITHASAVNQNGKAFWGDVMTSLEVDNTYVALQCGRNNAAEIMRYVTLRYTKTTDTAGSGSYAPTGVPTHHYDTDEQVIGTWADGSTLYEKTFEFNPPFSTRNDLTLNLPGNAWIKEWKVFLSDNVSSPVTIGQGDELKVINANFSRIVVDIASGTLPYVTNGQISVTVRYTKIV